MSASPAPTLRVERRLLREGASVVAAVDEVGRGALSGPVTVGVVLVTSRTRSAPPGVRDSKVLRAAVREDLVPRIRRWAAGYAVAHASALEVDERGVVAALRLAGHRALRSLDLRPDVILLDGDHDYLTAPAAAPLFESPDDLDDLPAVVTMVRADVSCAAVAAASVLAKTTRDALMSELARQFPHYGWHENKGYATEEHRRALAEFGPTPLHRRTWHLGN
ncbi:MAG: ribonuclease HII [Acidimicrobiales bacterium]